MWSSSGPPTAAVTALTFGRTHAVPTTRDEAYARWDLLLEQAVAEGGDYADVHDLMAETERQVAALPEAANLP